MILLIEIHLVLFVPPGPVIISDKSGIAVRLLPFACDVRVQVQDSTLNKEA